MTNPSRIPVDRGTRFSVVETENRMNRINPTNRTCAVGLIVRNSETMKSIQVDEDVLAALFNRAKGFHENENGVLRRLLDLPPSSSDPSAAKPRPDYSDPSPGGRLPLPRRFPHTRKARSFAV